MADLPTRRLLDRFRPTDAQVIDRLRRFQRWRRWPGAALILIGLLGIAAGMYGERVLSEALREAAEEPEMARATLERVESAEDARRIAESRIRTAEAEADWAWWFGLFVGGLAGTFLVIAVGYVALGVALVLGGRKDRLLLSYHDRLQKLGELPASEADRASTS